MVLSQVSNTRPGASKQIGMDEGHPKAGSLWMQPAGCTLIRMTISSLLSRISRFAESHRVQAPVAVLHLLLAVLISMSCAVCAWAWPAKDFETATVVEATQYIPCSDACYALQSPASAFCFRVGDEYMVGEEIALVHDEKLDGREYLTGMQVSISPSRWFITMRPPDGHAVRLKRGSLYEHFKDNGCVAEVHKPILEHANSSRRSAKIPNYAIAIAGSGLGDFQPLYLWFECAMNSDAATIGCKRWYGNGDSDGMDFYCARTVDGVPVAASFTIDPLLSQAGRLVLTSGAVLEHDNRGRTNGKLDRPNEACR
jgi:hypothetical protein